MEEGTEGATVVVTVDPMVDLTADRASATPLAAYPTMAQLTAVLIMAIGSAAGQAGFTASATSGIASGIAGIRTATTGRAGTFAALTGSQRDELASGAVELMQRDGAARA
jgi:hypothetical protein